MDGEFGERNELQDVLHLHGQSISKEIVFGHERLDGSHFEFVRCSGVACVKTDSVGGRPGGLDADRRRSHLRFLSLIIEEARHAVVVHPLVVVAQIERTLFSLQAEGGEVGD